MSEEIRNIEPKQLWENFYQLTNIPRPSKNEMKAALFIKELGKKLNLETSIDEIGNVIIRKPASPGLENLKGVILQAHVDMVPQVNNDKVFDFSTDSIDAFIQDGWVTADGTTLGADNGIGVAAILAILESKEIQHGPIEALITVDEETGLSGAFALKPGMLKGEILINLDSEDEDVISIGCAGGVSVTASWHYEDDCDVTGDTAYKISVLGLKGGHSGLDIHLGRGNACKITGRILKKVIRECSCRLASINCGNMRNAIPREGEAVITIKKDQSDKFLKLISNMQTVLMNELGLTEPDLKIQAETINMPSKLIPVMIQDDVVNAICAARNGIIRMSDSMPGVVETSSNFSVVDSSEGKIDFLCLTRSFIDSARDGVASSLESCFQLAGAKVETVGSYPGWKPNRNSEILSVFREVYNSKKGVYPNEVAMHAGLECGVFQGVYPEWDMISFGPTIKFPHSPDEKVNISSVKNFWEILVEVLKKVPKTK
ncbi:MAG: aminoacyl-histidine dipeptidase [Prolixibacteraceae bacterium]|nr:aminoacyl-histidine dipeptidase [Prolixibacteraceae bacterium]